MRRLILRLVFPLTIIMFALFTKWWYVFVDDIGEDYMYGFPLIYKCKGWHTSMSTQYFVLEFFVDFMFYFISCFAIIYTIKKWFTIHLRRSLMLLLWIIGLLALSYNEISFFFPDNRYEFKRNFEIDVIDTGFRAFSDKMEKPKEEK